MSAAGKLSADDRAHSSPTCRGRGILRNTIWRQVGEISFFSNDEREGVHLYWSSDIGFGEYKLYRDKKTGAWYGDSECMDKGEDKAFLEELLKEFSKGVLKVVKIDG